MLPMVWVTRCFSPEPYTSGPDESRVPMFFLGRLAELGPCASGRCFRERWGRLQVPGRLDESGVAAAPAAAAAAAAALADTAEQADAEVACAAAPEELGGAAVVATFGIGVACCFLLVSSGSISGVRVAADNHGE